MPLTTKIILHFYFPFKIFPENERERERERARARERRSDQWRDLTTASSRRIQIAIDGGRGRSEIAPSINDDKSSPTARSRSRLLREIAIDGAISRSVDRDLGSSSLAVDRDFFLGCGLCFFLDLCFPSSFPNTKKYFPENFLKCNQTRGNIFLFRKLAFPENMYFPENVLQQPNTA